MAAEKTVADKSRRRKYSRNKFLRFFPKGYSDNKYLQWERNYKWNAHMLWEELLNKDTFSGLLQKHQYREICKRAVNIEAKTNLLFSFEKMALRDAVKAPAAAKAFAWGLYNYIYGEEEFKQRFENFVEVIAGLPRKQTRVLTWPLLTVFGFIANPKENIFLKPKVTQLAARNFGYDFHYTSKPNWDTYKSLLDFAKEAKKETKDLKPKDMMDLQSFIWVLGSDEYS